MLQQLAEAEGMACKTQLAWFDLRTLGPIVNNRRIIRDTCSWTLSRMEWEVHPGVIDDLDPPYGTLLNSVSEDGETPGWENTLSSVITEVLVFGSFKKLFHVIVMNLLVTTTCTHHGERLGSMIPSSSNLFTSWSMKTESSWLYHWDLEAIGWQSAVRFANGSGGSIFSLRKLQTSKGGSEPHNGKWRLNAGIGNQDQGLGQHKVKARWTVCNLHIYVLGRRE